MKSAVETLSPTRAKLTVEVPFEELKPSLDAAYKKIAQQINVPGFRRGKVPPMVIDRQVGRGAVLDEAINEVAAAEVHRGAAGERARRRWRSRRSRSPSSRTTSASSSPPRSTSGPRSSCPDYDGPRGRRSRTSRSPTRTSRSRSRRCVSASAPCATSSAPPPTATSSSSTSRPAKDGEVVEGAEVSRHVLPGRPRRHARRSRRGPRRPDRRRDDDLRLRARRRRPGRRGRRGRRSPSRRSRSRSCPSSTTSSPSWPRSSTPSRS